MTSHSIPKIGCHYFWPGLIALQKNTLPKLPKSRNGDFGKKNSEKNRNFYFKLYIFHMFDFSEKIHEVTKTRPLPNFILFFQIQHFLSEIWLLKGLS